ncbi:MAG: hypothetical protein AB9903_05155 [Vulcanimicrobiota bacterium]
MDYETKRISVEEAKGQHELPAGCFSSWLRCARYGLIKDTDIVVNCGECRGCCTSSYFIHIRPDETQTLARINKKLLFPAPGQSRGTMLMGYDDKGCCPMYSGDRCLIYQCRPCTCRSYDCRIFTAAGIDAGDDSKAQINQRVRRWKFSYPTSRDRDKHSAVLAAAKFMQERSGCFPAGVVPDNPTQLALLSIKVYEVFLNRRDECDKKGHKPSDRKIVKAVTAALEKFEEMQGKYQACFSRQKPSFAPMTIQS